MKQDGRRIVCLANSRKPSGRCIAGKLFFQGKFGNWIRPISMREGEELSELERQIGTKTEPALLDILEFSIIAPKPTHHQTENWIMNPAMKMRKVGSISPKDLMLALDKPINLWVVGSSSKRGRNDFVPEGRIQEVTDSLFLINPIFISIQVLTDDYNGLITRQVRGEFTYCGAEYNLKITDPLVEAKYLAKSDGVYKIQNVLLTISLTEKIFRPRYSHSVGFYKLIAGIIEIPEGG